MKKLTLILYILLWLTPLFCQKSPIDSLAQLPLYAPLAQRSALLYLIDDYIKTINSLEEKKIVAQHYLEIAKSRQDSLHIGNSYQQLSESYQLLNDPINQKAFEQKYQAIKKIGPYNLFWQAKEEKSPGLIEGYPFNGHFQLDDPANPFKVNPIFTHELYVDPTGKAKIKDIVENWNNLEVQDVFDLSLENNEVYWLKMRFDGSPFFFGEQIILVQSMHISYFDYVDSYISNKRIGGFQHQRTGRNIPLSERPYNFWASFIKLDLLPSDTLDVYIRMEGGNKDLFSETSLPLFHVDKSSVFPQQVNLAWKNGLFFGILGIQCLYFLLLFLVERERIHLYFVLLILGLFLVLGFNRHFSDFVAFPSLDRHLYFLAIIGFQPIAFGLLYYTLTYFNYTTDSFIRKKLAPILYGLFLLVGIIEFTGGPNKTVSTISGIIFCLILLTTLCLPFFVKKQKMVSKKYFLLAFSPFLFHLFFTVVAILSVIDQNSIASEVMSYVLDPWQITIVLMVLLLALSSGYRTNSFKEAQLAEQKRINQAISRFVPNEFLAALGKENITEINLGDNTEKEVTIFFSDIRNYTSLSEQMTPAENFQFVNTYNAQMGPIIQQNNGFVNQYLGDGIMAIFPDSSTDAIKAAIQMQQEIQKYNQRRIQEGHPPIKVGMGMHTGSLIMGITGDENRLDAATIADSVNSAARIESLTKYYKNTILLSEASLQQLDKADSMHLRYLGQVQVKGKQKALKIYECFDGDLPTMMALKRATLAKFESGIKAYFKKEFTKAIVAFESVLQQNPADKTTQLFLEKANLLAKTGVEANWTGVELMNSK